MAAQVNIPALKVTKYSSDCSGIPVAGQVFLWLPRWGCPASKLSGIPIAGPGIPIAAQMGMPILQVTRSSHGWPGYSYGCKVPMAAQVGMPSLQVSRYSYTWPEYSYGCQVGCPDSKLPGIPIAGQVFLWVPRWGCPASKLPGIPQ